MLFVVLFKHMRPSLLRSAVNHDSRTKPGVQNWLVNSFPAAKAWLQPHAQSILLPMPKASCARLCCPAPVLSNSTKKPSSMVHTNLNQLHM
jgi:hypothetical protein